jgi:hypothetical protein
MGGFDRSISDVAPNEASLCQGLIGIAVWARGFEAGDSVGVRA